MPMLIPVPEYVELCNPILKYTPVPGLAPGYGEIPKSRSEIRLFIGFTPAASFSALSGGFGKNQAGKPGFISMD